MAYIPRFIIISEKKNKAGDAPLPMKYVLEVVAELFETSVEGLFNKSQKRKILWPRQVAMYFAAYYTALSLKAIAIYFNKKDHTTTIHSIQQVEDLMHTDPKVREQIDLLSKKFDTYAEMGRENKRCGEGEYPGHA